MNQLGLAAAFSIVPGPCTLETAKAEASLWARNQTEQIMRLFTQGPLNDKSAQKASAG